MNRDLTQQSQPVKRARAKKMMLWFGIVSLIMTFAGWTSAYIVSSSREDWLEDYQLPEAFWYSTGIIIVSSLLYWMALRAVRQGRQQAGSLLLGATLLAGVLFIYSQFTGFSQMIDYGYYFTGPTSNITLSYLFLIAAVHIVHVVAGIISLIVVLVNQLRGKYGPGNLLGMELGSTFWHFLDLLWVYLMAFFYFFG
ncbi:cytochrome c oxidase subunit 3 [Robiginitalea sp. SC105]|uniref:cytochrome c oxidase subunit 3 n=1 Tax=Robiginitalea sp. SC105 TaxID=2762332 RepID=UPI00163A64B3|nr:cytochrome c oxidase subunit 3 [Robiginitalea sp. SC105]MBC2838786.1 cytochrome c oxidase subunit 3 [Robiginitalea sp. SC105]